MSTLLQDRKRALLLARSRKQNEESLAKRYFHGDVSAFRWAEPKSGEAVRPSPVWRLWITSWEALQELADEFRAISELVVKFGSMPEVQGVLVFGDTVSSHLEMWVKNDKELIQIADSKCRWEISLDIHNIEGPRLVLVSEGKVWFEPKSFSSGTEPWRWEFISDELSAAVDELKYILLAQEHHNLDQLRDLLSKQSLVLDTLTRQGSGESMILVVGVGSQSAGVWILS